MTIKYLTFLLAIPLAIGCWGCGEEQASYQKDGKVVGTVEVHDTTSGYITRADSYEGVEVIFDDGNNQYRGMSDEEGWYEVTGLGTGTYDVTYQKEGFCSHKVVGYQFIGGENAASIQQARIYPKNEAVIDSLAIENATTEFDLDVSIRIIGRVSNKPVREYADCRLFLHDSTDIAYNNYTMTKYIGFGIEGVDSEELLIDTTQFPIGSEIFLLMIPATERDQKYLDANTGHYVYTSLNFENASEVVSTTIEVPDGFTPRPTVD